MSIRRHCILRTKVVFSLALSLLTLIPAAACHSQGQATGSDPLPSWREGTAKAEIVAFVQSVTNPASADFVPVAERIAVFDNDGTLWCEYPLPNQAVFAFDEVKRLLPEHPEWNEEPGVQALLNHDTRALLADNYRGLLKILALSHAGMSDVEFERNVARWLLDARHPRFNVPYTQTVYQPMLELLEYLRQHDFQTWIVSGGGQDFMRVFAEQTYGIPPHQVIGSHTRMRYELKDGQPVLTKTLENLFIDDKEGKPVGIAQFIGRRPIACFGNSDGDQAMLEYTTLHNPRRSLGVLIHHTDGEREYAYDANPPGSGRLETALQASKQHGWTVVDMQRDWSTVFVTALPDQAGGPGSELQPAALMGKWLAEDIGGRGVIDRAQSTLEIGDGTKIAGSTAVNRYSGTMTVDGNRIQFDALAMTRRAGPPAVMDQEARFTTALRSTRSFTIDERGMLLLLDENGNVVLVLSRLAE
jgi:heat shock protein HslJ